MLSIPQSVIYVASSVHTFTTARYKRLIAPIRDQWSESLILEAKHLYTSDSDWLRRWDATLKVITGLVYFTDARGFYGRGVDKELEDAQHRIPPVEGVWYCDDRENGYPAITKMFPNDSPSFVTVSGVVHDPRRCYCVIPRECEESGIEPLSVAKAYWRAREKLYPSSQWQLSPGGMPWRRYKGKDAAVRDAGVYVDQNGDRHSAAQYLKHLEEPCPSGLRIPTKRDGQTIPRANEGV